jgi:uncharacterized protein GlcG (DUF336 family)
MTSTITAAGADKAIEAGRAKAAQLGIAFTIAIVDAGAAPGRPVPAERRGPGQRGVEPG